MKYQIGTFSWVQGGWLTAGMILPGSSFLALGSMADNFVSISHWFGLDMSKNIPFIIIISLSMC